MRKSLVLLALLAVPALLAACGPMSLHAAEERCFETARQARFPTGEAGIGVGSGGRRGGHLEVNISSDWLLGKDPSAVYETCVMSKSGQAPSRPLYQRPDWKG